MNRVYTEPWFKEKVIEAYPSARAIKPHSVWLIMAGDKIIGSASLRKNAWRSAYIFSKDRKKHAMELIDI